MKNTAFFFITFKLYGNLTISVMRYCVINGPLHSINMLTNKVNKKTKNKTKKKKKKNN